MPFRIGPTELIIVLVIIMIVFGVGKLPEIGGGLGKGIREFRKGQSGLTKGLSEDDAEDEAAEGDEPAKPKSGRASPKSPKA